AATLLSLDARLDTGSGRRGAAAQQENRQVVGELVGVGMAFHRPDDRGSDVGEAVVLTGPQGGFEADLVERDPALALRLGDAVAVNREQILGLNDRMAGGVR